MLIHFFVVIGIKHDIDRVAAQHLVQCSDGKHGARIYLLRAHNYRPINLSEGITLLQVVEPDEGTYFGAVSKEESFLVYRQRAHIIGNNAHVTQVIFG